MFENQSKEIYEQLELDMIEEDISIIQSTSGNTLTAPRACKSGSSVYILLSTSGDVLYVGETGVSVKSRCFGDGSGAHSKKPWFSEVARVKHFTKDSDADFSVKERKLAEQALSIHLSPKYYG